MSAIPLKADIAERYRHVRFVPKADIAIVLQSSTNIPDGVWSCQPLARNAQRLVEP